jgi:hypothetical protein
VGTRRPICATVVALAVPLLAACGGEASSYSLGSTFSCLNAHADSVTYHLDDTDYFVFDDLARKAGGGALYADLGRNSVVVVFERSESDAKRTEAAYREGGHPLRLAAGADGATLDTNEVLRRSGNAVLLWTRRPPDDTEAVVVDSCLSG